MHIPKCAGTSVREALEQALPAGSLAPQGYVADGDPVDFARLPPERRSEFAVGLDEMRAIGCRYQAILGHFDLDTLLAITDAASVCTVVREPRARLLSVYMYSRVPGVAADWAYNPTLHALRQLNEFLAEPFRAPQIDNVLCRMLLGNDPRLPPQQFAAQSDLPAVAADAIERLESLGFVGALESGESFWPAVSRAFGVTLRPAAARITGSEAFIPQPLRPDEKLFDAESLDLLERCCAGDKLVYDHALAKAGEDDAGRRRITEAAFATELVKLGDLLGTGDRAASDSEIPRLEGELERSHKELTATREWLSSVQSSASWRLTAPLRTAKQRLLPGSKREG